MLVFGLCARISDEILTIDIVMVNEFESIYRSVNYHADATSLWLNKHAIRSLVTCF